MNLKLDWCAHKAAKFAVERWHYSRRMPTPPLVNVGAWEDDSFVGVVIFGRGNARNLNKQYGLKKTEIAELVRIAMKDHETPTSRIVSIAIKMLRKQSPGLKLIVSYSDLDQDHLGTLYQASNFVYVGWTKGSEMFRDKRGRMWHTRMLSPTGWKKVYGKYRPVMKPADLTRIKTKGRHKYLYPLTREMRKIVETMKKEFPKRADSVTVAHPAQQERGGSTPTSALQSRDAE